MRRKKFTLSDLQRSVEKRRMRKIYLSAKSYDDVASVVQPDPEHSLSWIPLAHFEYRGFLIVRREPLSVTRAVDVVRAFAKRLMDRRSRNLGRLLERRLNGHA